MLLDFAVLFYQRQLVLQNKKNFTTNNYIAVLAINKSCVKQLQFRYEVNEKLLMTNNVNIRITMLATVT